MYQTIGNTAVITKNDWNNAGLTDNQLWKDSRSGFLRIYRRGTKGNTLIDLHSIQRPDRLEMLIKHLGSKVDALDSKMEAIATAIESLTRAVQLLSDRAFVANNIQSEVKQEAEKKISIFQTPEIDLEARTWFLSYRKPDGQPLKPELITKYVNKCSILNAVCDALQAHREARAKHSKKPSMGEFWKAAQEFYLEQSVMFPCDPIINARSFERVFKGYFNGNKKNCDFIISGKIGNDNTRIVTKDTSKLVVALWNKHDKPFIKQVHKDYLEFLDGKKEFFDKKTGEVFNPSDFKVISEGTVWNILKAIPHIAATLQERDGYFNYNNNFSPKHERKNGQYSLSKVTMDDLQLSRTSTKGDVCLYKATDVVSGYMFKPVYIIGKPTVETVTECVRNMFIELTQLGLPGAYEADTEKHLIKDISWFPLIFPVVTMNESATAKRQEHYNRQFKYTVCKRNGHIENRFYGKGAYKGIKIKMKGDFVRKKYDPQVLIADDLSDIEEWNNELHPNQKTWPGKTRKEVFLENVNPELKPVAPYLLWKCIGERTETSIVKNKRIRANNQVFWLKDYDSLAQLKPNCYDVEAYYMKNSDGNAETVYLYQGDRYIGEAYDIDDKRYNDCRAEWTDKDRENYLFQSKEQAKFHKLVKDIKGELPKIGAIQKEAANELEEIISSYVEIVETPQVADIDAGEYVSDEYVTVGDYAMEVL